MIFLICQDRDGCVPTVTIWSIVIISQLRIWILRDIVVANNDIRHWIGVIINLNALQTISKRDVVFN